MSPLVRQGEPRRRTAWRELRALLAVELVGLAFRADPATTIDMAQAMTAATRKD